MSSFNSLLPGGKKEFLAQALDASGLNYLLSNFSSWSGLLVLNYHRIGSPYSTQLNRNLFSTTAEEFEKQVVMFQQHADIVGIDDLEEVQKSKRGKHILLTFDDGYRDNYELALPVLKDCNAKAVFFIATGFIDQPRIAWWDEMAWMMRHASRSKLPPGPGFPDGFELTSNTVEQATGMAVKHYWSLPCHQTEDFLNQLAELTGAGRTPIELASKLWMNWEMIREMTACGQSIGGHTVNHPILAQCTRAEQQQEIEQGRNRLAEMLGQAPEAFAYPVGQPHMFTTETESLLEQAGYRWGFSFYGNYSQLPLENRFDIPRCAVDFGQSDQLLRSRLTLPQIFSKK